MRFVRQSCFGSSCIGTAKNAKEKKKGTTEPKGWKPQEWQENAEWKTYTFKAVDQDARDLGRLSKHRDDELMQLVVRMWEMDDQKAPSTNAQDEKIFQYLREKLMMKNGKYVLPTLWKQDRPQLINNYDHAKKRLESLLSSSQMKDERVLRAYGGQIKEWEGDAYIEEVTTSTPRDDEAYYLPHFAVVRWEKLSTQVRIVMDGAAKYGRKPSLNDCVKKGPKLINELTTVLLRFRKKEICISADIKKMFFQIGMTTQDRNFHRFLWVDKGQEKIYRWKVHPFGSAASPCIAIFTIKEHARKWRQELPRAAETVIKSTLVDDNLDSCRTKEETIRLGKELVELFSKAGMRLGKIVSNSQEVLEAFPENMRAESLDIAGFCTEDLQLPLVKALGTIYLAQEDAFSFKMQMPEEGKGWTKRQVLRHEATLYDVHGLISPHTVKARIIIQMLWRSKKGWDEKIEGTPLREWEKWLTASKALPQLRIPRAVTGDSREGFRIHVFCDASGEAYAAAAYFTTRSDSRLIISKARVAPLKVQSIPRLELMAAETATEVAKMVTTAITIQPDDLVFWTDSMNVLCWLDTETRDLNPFVANRVSRILETTRARQWQWVPTADNPADIPSRGETADKLVGCRLWWEGPKFIKGSKQDWPKRPNVVHNEETLKEVRKGAAFRTTHKYRQDGYNREEDPWAHVQFSSWKKVVRVFARVRRVWNRADGEELTGEELAKARYTVLKIMQETALAGAVAEVEEGGTTRKNGPTQGLSLFLDHRGIVRIDGRLKHCTSIPYEQRHQIVVPKDHPWTELLIMDTHQRLFHQGKNHVLEDLRKDVWVVRAKQKIGSLIRKCIECRRQRPRIEQPHMAPLPQERRPEERCDPFTYTSVDAAGPFYTKEKNEQQESKAYFILYTCNTYRAVHLEPIYDMTASSFLQTLDRFTARRGTPRRIRSDNGTNLVAAKSELGRLWRREEREQYRQKRDKIEWIFQPPHAPHMGGVHERMIGAAKRALYHAFKPNTAVTRETFHTALVVVEGILNTRPLTEPTTLPPFPPFLLPVTDLWRSTGWFFMCFGYVRTMFLSRLH